MGIEQHLVGLQRIGQQKERPAVREHDMRHLQFGALTAENRKIVTPVKLEHIAGIKMQQNKGPTPRRLLFALPI